MATVPTSVSKLRKGTARIHPASLLETDPLYVTNLGAAYTGDSRALLKLVPSGSVNAIITSPPYALRSKKPYGNHDEHTYVDWFLEFAAEFRRILRPHGSLVVEIGGTWNRRQPTRSVYHFELLVRLVKDARFHLAEEFFWFNRARMPSPAEWVNVQRIRVKDAVTPIWWLSPSQRPRANNRRVLTPYSAEMRKLLENGYNRGKRPSGHVAKKFERDNGGAIPPNLLVIAHTSSTDVYQSYCRERGIVVHPARFPRQIPEFFVKFLTRKGDLILDPFGGSNMTGYVAEKLGRRWLAFEKEPKYVESSEGRFLADETFASSVVRGNALLTRGRNS
jgi:DNA modification methylase